MKRFEPLTKIHIKTKKYYIKYCGMLSFDTDVLYLFSGIKLCEQ